MNNIHNSNEPPDFSLVLGGPLFQLLLRSRLTSPALELMKRRIVFISLFAWLPLLLLSLVAGKAWGGVGLPFLYDLEMQARFLVALPLLIAAELLVHQWLRPVVAQFVDNDIITAKALPEFKEVIASAMKLRNSVAIELFIFFLIFVGRALPLEHGKRYCQDRGLCGNLVCHRGQWRRRAHGGRLPVHFRQPAPVSIHLNPMVFPVVHLGSFSVAECPARTQSYPDPPRPSRRPRVSWHELRRFYAAAPGPWGAAGGTDRQPDLFRRGQTDRFYDGNTSRWWRFSCWWRWDHCWFFRPACSALK